jgi:ArsR family transcriptional regulator, lead/cadmium/zinc/bismuth-responsive transcriptional repressor
MARKPQLSDDQATELAEMFRLMGDQSRLRIILCCLDGPTAVGDIAERLGLSASLVSHHLRLLRAARILRAARRGKQVFYAAADAHIRRVLIDMTAHVGEAAA